MSDQPLCAWCNNAHSLKMCEACYSDAYSVEPTLEQMIEEMKWVELHCLSGIVIARYVDEGDPDADMEGEGPTVRAAIESLYATWRERNEH